MSTFTLKSNDKKNMVIKSDEERFVLGEVYAPFHVDSQGEAITVDEIRKMAHNFLKSGKVNKIDINHNYEESGCVVVESFIVRNDDDIDGFRKGAWVAGVNVLPDILWNKIKKGDFNGFSFGGKALSTPIDAIVLVAKKAIGETTESLNDNVVPIHFHKVNLTLDENGNILNGIVEEYAGHTHEITKVSATENTLGHNHRLILEDINGK